MVLEGLGFWVDDSFEGLGRFLRVWGFGLMIALRV